MEPPDIQDVLAEIASRHHFPITTQEQRRAIGAELRAFLEEREDVRAFRLQDVTTDELRLQGFYTVRVTVDGMTLDVNTGGLLMPVAPA